VLAGLLGLEVPSRWKSADDLSRAKYGEEFVECRDLGLLIGRLLRGNETFYEWGSESGIYFAARKRPPTGVFYSMPLYSRSSGQHLLDRVLSDLKKRPPDLLVISRKWSPVPRPDGEPPHPLQLLPAYRLIRPHPFDSTYALFARRGTALEQRLVDGHAELGLAER
jgi:hypothetical protein